LVGSQFQTGRVLIDVHLQSCQLKNVELQYASNDCLNHTDLFDAFCCYEEADTLNFDLCCSLMSTIIFLISCVVIQRRPSELIQDENNKSIYRSNTQSKMITSISVYELLNNKRFILANISTFFVISGPEMFFATISRFLPIPLLPHRLTITIIGIFCGIPISFLIAKGVVKHKIYYYASCFLYISATMIWMSLYLGQLFQEMILISVMISLTVIVYFALQIVMLELKTEYAYKPNCNAEGKIVSFDRIFASVSAFTYILAIPPERFGLLTMILVCLISMIVGCLFLFAIPNPTKYNRVEETLIVDNSVHSEDFNREKNNNDDDVSIKREISMRV
jgi:hypothetical protein